MPVYSERGRDGGYRLLGGYRSRLTGLDRDEARALVEFGAAGPAHELGLGRALMSARLKLAAALPAGLREDVPAAAGRFHLDAPGWFAPRIPVPRLEALAAGVFGGLAVQARYRGRSGARDCLLEPLGLVLKGGRWYVVAGEGGQVRGYRADRFSSAAVTKQAFRRPAGFDLAAFWAQWSAEFERGLPVVQVSVRAKAGCVPRLRRVVEQAHAGKVGWDAAPDPGGWIRLMLPFERPEYARAALLGFGPDVEVLAPAALRREMAVAAVGLAALYAVPPPRCRVGRGGAPGVGDGPARGAAWKSAGVARRGGDAVSVLQVGGYALPDGEPIDLYADGDR